MVKKKREEREIKEVVGKRRARKEIKERRVRTEDGEKKENEKSDTGERTQVTKSVLAHIIWSDNLPYKVNVWALILTVYFPLFHK